MQTNNFILDKKALLSDINEERLNALCTEQPLYAYDAYENKILGVVSYNHKNIINYGDPFEQLYYSIYYANRETAHFYPIEGGVGKIGEWSRLFGYTIDYIRRDTLLNEKKKLWGNLFNENGIEINISHCRLYGVFAEIEDFGKCTIKISNIIAHQVFESVSDKLIGIIASYSPLCDIGSIETIIEDYLNGRMYATFNIYFENGEIELETSYRSGHLSIAEMDFVDCVLMNENTHLLSNDVDINELLKEGMPYLVGSTESKQVEQVDIRGTLIEKLSEVITAYEGAGLSVYDFMRDSITLVEQR